jgi:hypothetical protein
LKPPLANFRRGRTATNYSRYSELSRKVSRPATRRRAEGGGAMNELEPDTWRSQWLWFGAALLAMSMIVAISTRFPV